MAKGSKSKVAPVADGIDKDLLAKIASGAVTTVDRDLAMKAGLSHQPPLIEVGAVDMASGQALVRISEAGTAYLAAATAPAPAASNGGAENFTIITNAVLPPSKRGNTGGGAPVKYPFDKLEVGASFFVPVSEKLPDPVKTLGSTVSSANMRYASETGETKEVTRAKRDGRKAALDSNGQKIMETKQVPVYKFARKFSIRGVEAGQAYGGWTAPAKGALIARIPVE